MVASVDIAADAPAIVTGDRNVRPLLAGMAPLTWRMVAKVLGIGRLLLGCASVDRCSSLRQEGREMLFVLPDSEHLPALGDQPGCDLRVPGSPLASTGVSGVLQTSVPVAAIHEDGDACTTRYEVGRSEDAGAIAVHQLGVDSAANQVGDLTLNEAAVAAHEVAAFFGPGLAGSMPFSRAIRRT